MHAWKRIRESEYVRGEERQNFLLRQWETSRKGYEHRPPLGRAPPHIGLPWPRHRIQRRRRRSIVEKLSEIVVKDDITDLVQEMGDSPCSHVLVVVEESEVEWLVHLAGGDGEVRIGGGSARVRLEDAGTGLRLSHGRSEEVVVQGEDSAGEVMVADGPHPQPECNGRLGRICTNS